MIPCYRIASARALFTRYYVMHKGWNPNPSLMTSDQRMEIRAHPQFYDPFECEPTNRLFELPPKHRFSRHGLGAGQRGEGTS